MSNSSEPSEPTDSGDVTCASALINTGVLSASAIDVAAGASGKSVLRDRMNPVIACCVGERSRGIPRGVVFRGVVFLGVGVFATRRRYQTALERLKACVAARHQQLRKGAGPVCDLAVASSNWRIFVREDARAAANLVARRFSHFLDCGAAGWLADCASKDAGHYFRHYAADFECKRREPTRCEPLCEHLLERSGKSRPSVDTLLSPRRAMIVRGVLGVLAAVGAVGSVGLVRPGSPSHSSKGR